MHGQQNIKKYVYVVYCYYKKRVSQFRRVFHRGFPDKILYVSLPSPTHATCPAYPILDLITRIIFSE